MVSTSGENVGDGKITNRSNLNLECRMKLDPQFPELEKGRRKTLTEW